MLARNQTCGALGLFLLVSGCAGSGPPALRYDPGALEWTAPSLQPESYTPPAPLGTLLGDPRLERLIALALANNPEIGVALARVERARAELIGLRGQALPSLTAEAGLGREFQRTSGQSLDFKSGFGRLDASWEPDLFGRLRAETRAGAARAKATDWDRFALEQAIAAQVARAWVQRATLSRRLTIIDQIINRSEELERIVRVRHEAGAATRVDLGLQAIRVLDLKQRRKEIEQNLDQTRTALALLVGAPAPGYTLEVPQPADLTMPAIKPPAPQQVLALRPDIRAAEARILAAEGNVGAARAAFFPRLSFSFVGMIEALTGQPTTRSVSLGSSLLAPIFARGSLNRDLKVAQAEQREAAETYRLTILTALVEVEDLLRAQLTTSGRSALIDKIATEAELTARLSKAQYLEGEEGLTTLIDAEELLSQAQESQVLVWQESMLTQIALYQAIGGQGSR